MSALAIQTPPEGEYRPLGTARWLSGTAVIKTYKRGDFLLGRTLAGQSVGVKDDRHVYVGCGNRGGKGVSILIPNLLLWPGSVVVIDPKGENAMITARRRGSGSKYSYGMGQKVYILDPFDTVRNQVDEFEDLKCAFNPMDALSADCEESVDTAARIAEAMVVAENASDPYFHEAARDFIRDVMLHVATASDFQADERNLSTMRRCIVAGDYKAHRIAVLNTPPDKKPPSPFYLLGKSMMRNPAFGGLINQAGVRLLELASSPRTLNSIVQVASTNTTFIDSPGMRRCLARSDFSLAELKTAAKGSTLYLCLPQRFMETHFRWLRMMVTLTIGEMEAIKHQPMSGHPVMMVLDEFPGLKRMSVLEHAAAQIAGFGVKLVMVSQTLAQLKEIYKDNWETLLANAGVKLFFCNDDHFSREYISKLVGETEVVRTAQSKSNTASLSSSNSRSTTSGQSSGSNFGSSHGFTTNNMQGSMSSNASMGISQGISMSEGESEAEGFSSSDTEGLSESVQKRSLLNPDEVGRMFGDRSNPMALALISGHQPLALRRLSYFTELGLGGFYDPHADHALPRTKEKAVEFKLARAARVSAEAADRAARSLAETIRLEDETRQAALEEVLARQRIVLAAQARQAEAEREVAAARNAKRQRAKDRVELGLLALGGGGGRALCCGLRPLVARRVDSTCGMLSRVLLGPWPKMRTQCDAAKISPKYHPEILMGQPPKTGKSRRSTEGLKSKSASGAERRSGRMLIHDDKIAPISSGKKSTYGPMVDPAGVFAERRGTRRSPKNVELEEVNAVSLWLDTRTSEGLIGRSDSSKTFKRSASSVAKPLPPKPKALWHRDLQGQSRTRVVEEVLNFLEEVYGQYLPENAFSMRDYLRKHDPQFLQFLNNFGFGNLPERFQMPSIRQKGPMIIGKLEKPGPVELTLGERDYLKSLVRNRP